MEENQNFKIYPGNPQNCVAAVECDSVEEVFYDSLDTIGELDYLKEPVRNVDPEDIDVSSEENNKENDVGYILHPELLQRPPSHITIRNLTLPKYNTYPKLQKDFNEAKKRQKSCLKAQVSSQSNVSEGVHSKTMATPASDSYELGKKTVTFGSTTELAKEKSDSSQVTGAMTELAKEESQSPQVTGDIYVHDKEMKSIKSIDHVDSDETWYNLNEVSDHALEKNFDIIESGVCMECVRAIEVNSRDEIKPGDHITFSGRVYDHHAIVIEVKDLEGEDASKIHIEIVHATNTSAKATFASLHPFGKKARLKQVSEIVNIKENKVMVYKYSSRMKPFPPSVIVKRAIAEAKADLEGGQGQFKYDLFRNNCEHFVTWCVTGRKLSLQVRKFSMVFWMFLKSGFYGISDEFLRNEKEYENGMLCESCYLRNKTLLKISKTTIFEADQVKAGDIITYSYYFLWHSAVVLQILKTADNYMECEIAHYAYLGPFKHREIKKESIIIPLNGSVYVTVFPDNFDIYHPTEVVERARSRIGEQMFAFFSNDSSQFSRWCKLKLQKQAT